VVIHVCKYIKQARLTDPVHSCDVHKQIGCSHVDGYLCNVNTCDILSNYKNTIKNKYNN